MHSCGFLMMSLYKVLDTSMINLITSLDVEMDIIMRRYLIIEIGA